MTFVLRPARLDDIARLQEIERDADSRYALEPGAPPTDVIPEDHARRFVDEGRITVAEREGQAVGWVLLGAIDGEPCIGQLSVAVAHGRRGIGAALLAHAIELAAARGGRSIVLNTERDVPWNAPWYARTGFEVVPEAAWSPALRAVTEQQRATGLDWSRRVHMRKKLGP
jgi:predicted N-acetyltransferase YhbS